LTAERLTDLLADAARAQLVASYAGDLKRRIEPLLVHAFHLALADGCGFTANGVPAVRA
jgi:hypothetical protein